MTNSTQKTTLYRYFDSDGQLLYVGITGDNTKRQSQHRRNSFWFGEIASATFEHFDDRISALEAEATAIQEEKPKFNILKTGFGIVRSSMVIDFSAKVHLVQMLSEPDGGWDKIHKDWAAEVKSWIAGHECINWDFDWDTHLAWHLYEIKLQYDHKARAKFLAHQECEKCYGIFTTEWFEQNVQKGINEILEWSNNER